MEEKKMEISNGRFPKTFSKCISALFKIKWSLARKYIIISIDPTQEINYVNIECANQLVIPQSNIIEMMDSMNNKQYDISNLQLNIGD